MLLPLYHLLLPLFLIGAVSASYCGKSGVPYSLEILPNGAPVLGCAQPTCVISALDADGEFQEDSQFLTDTSGQSDGFFRDGDRALKRYRHRSAPKLIANCSGQFNELSCPRRNQWVGGIEYIDHPRQPLILQCCTFEGLRFSQEVGSTTIGPGEAITGGEVVRAGRQISFDVIANVRKIVKAENSPNRVSYEVTVRRMNCLPDPPEPEVEFDSDVPAEVTKILANAKNKEVTDKFKQQQQPAAKKSRADKQKYNGAAKQQAAPTENLPEISGGEGDRPLAPIPRGQGKQPSRNSAAIIQPASRQQQHQQQQLAPAQAQLQQQQQQFQRGQFPQRQQLGPQQQQQPPQQFGDQPPFQQQQWQRQSVPTQNQQQSEQFQSQPPPQQQQQQPQPEQRPSGFQAGGADPLSATPHPLFGMMSFPTLPPHSFPTLPPHSFPTFPPHSFPTLPPHTFPSFAPHSFPTLPGFFGTTPAPGILGAGFHPAGSGPSAAGGGPIAFGTASAGGGPNGPFSSGGGFPGAGQPPFRPPPRVAPAMGTILAAMQGDRHPIMHPMLGLIGYSNGPPPGQQPGRK